MHGPATQQSIFRLPHSEELQGLRALAVGAVFLYHVDSDILPSGFVGVDIFFVLSGFLIGRKLIAELDETGSIDLFAFTSARARRLLPNALLVLLVVTVAAFFLLPPYRLAQVSGDIRSAALLFSNLHFASEAVDYLRIGGPPSPVLHFWSLSIEEQFYLGLPLLLLGVGALFRRHRIDVAIGLITAIAATSFLLGYLALQRSQPDAFFATQNRIWQLAIGVAVGWAVARASQSIPKHAATLLMIAAIPLLAMALFGLDASNGYPGFAALLPTAGTAALLFSLFCGPATFLNRVLSHPAARWLGDRSYSIYLWHWPFITIALANFPGSRAHAWAAALASILVADLAYRFVEEPIRHRRRTPARHVLAAAGGSILSVVAVTLLTRFAPLPPGAAERAVAVNQARDDLGGAYSSKCHLELDETEQQHCTFGLANGKKTVMLFGDSHAAHWFEPVRIAAERSGWKFLSRTKSSCPSVDVTIWYPPRAAVFDKCSEWRTGIIREIQQDPPDVLILANSSALRGWIAEQGEPANDDRAADLWRSGFVSLMHQIPAKTRVLMVRDVPRMANDVLSCLSYGDKCARPKADAMARPVDEKDLLSISPRPVTLLDFTDDICDATVCSSVVNGTIAYRDDNHITASFAASLYRPFSDAMTDTLGE